MEGLDTSSYAIVAEARGQEVLWYREFGSYQGEWLLLAYDPRPALNPGRPEYVVYKGWYGSCSGCDSLQAELQRGDTIQIGDPTLVKFLEDYRAFIEMQPREAMALIAEDGNLLTALPGNLRTPEWDSSERDMMAIAGRQMALAILVREEVIRAPEILEIDNLELRRKAVDFYGAERFTTNVGANPIAWSKTDGALFHIPREGQEPFAFLHVKDGSTDRSYILRVDPKFTDPREARASTFGFAGVDFVLALET